MSGPHMPPSILMPLLIMAIAFTFLFLTLHLKAMHTEVARRRLMALQRQAAQTRASA
jgi:heme exporter protein C